MEVQEINKASYRSMHTVTKVDKKWLRVTAPVIPGISLPLIMGMDGNAEDPDMQRKLSSLNTPKIFFSKDNKVPNPNVTVKHLGHIQRDMDHGYHTQMATECIRLGCKMNKSVELRISRVIQECTICKHEDVTFAYGHGKKQCFGSGRIRIISLDPDLALQETLIWIRLPKINRDKLAYKSIKIIKI